MRFGIMQILDLPLHKLIVPTPFHVGPVNVYVLTEPEVVLLDAGPKLPDARQAVVEGLAALSLKLSDVRKIYITHGHPDHYGQAAELAREAGAALFASPLDSPHFQHRTHAEFYRRMHREAGVPAEVIQIFEDGFEYIESLTAPVANYTAIGEGDELRCGNLTFEIVATPGHTPGSVCFYSRERRLLIAADTVIKRITPNPILDEDPSSPGCRYPSLKHYLASLEKIRRLQPRLVCSGHGDEVEAFDPLLAKMIRHHEERQEKILGLLKGGAKTLWALAHELFPQVEEDGMFLALSEVYAHADLLESRSKIRPVWDGEVRKIQAV